MNIVGGAPFVKDGGLLDYLGEIVDEDFWVAFHHFERGIIEFLVRTFAAGVLAFVVVRDGSSAAPDELRASFFEDSDLFFEILFHSHPTA